MNHPQKYFAVILGLCLTACSPTSSSVEYKREPVFFNEFVNTSENSAKAAEKINDLKLLATGEEYPMRLVLFDNGQFYYQMDRLGDGRGQWEYKEGALHLTASRPIFDMELSIAAQKADGNETSVQFYDRFGYNSISIQLRNPKSTSQSVAPLRAFTGSAKGI